MNALFRFFTRYRLALLLGTLALIAAVTAVAPLEKTLGANVRLVYFHGAWVWAGKAAFALAGLAGLAALAAFAQRRVPGSRVPGSRMPGMAAAHQRWAAWSLALGRAGMVFWLTYLPLSLLVQQLNWGGIYWDEPRWRVPLAFGVAGVALQAALVLFDQPMLTALGNLVFGAALWIGLANVQNVLHPDSPIFGSGSLRIELFFSGLVLLSLFCMLQIAGWFYGQAR